MKLESYEKGYLNAQAKAMFRVAVTIPGESEPTVFEIPLNSEITHGPYLGESGFGLAKIVTRPDLSGLDFPDELKASLSADTIVIEDVVDFSRQLNETVTVAPIKVTTKDATVIDFAGAKVLSQSSADNRYTFTADAMIEKLTVSNDDEPELFIMDCGISTSATVMPATMSALSISGFLSSPAHWVNGVRRSLASFSNIDR